MEEPNSPSDQDELKPSRFKIPKRKANSWNEEITVTSPLSRFSDSDFQNRPKQEHQPRSWSSTYNSFNRSRNHESFSYYRNNRSFNRQSPHPANSPNRFEQRPGFGTSPVHPSLHPREESANSVLSPGRSGNQELKGNQKDYPNQCNIDFNNPSPGLQEANLLDTVARKRRSGTPLIEEHLSFSKEKADIQSEEPIDNCSSTSVSVKRSSEKYSCYSKNSPSTEHLPETVHKPLEAEHKEVNQDCKKDLSFTSEKGPPILENSPKAKNFKVSAEKRLKTPESFSTHKLKTHEKMPTRRKCRERVFRTNPSKNPVDPIILSSDEEDEVSTDPENTQILHFSTTQYLLSDKKEDELNSQCPLTERLASQEGENQKVEQNLMRDDHLSCSKMGATFVRQDEKSSPVLEIEFSTVYFGKKKGRSKGRLKFSAATIEIPLHEALRSTMTLPVDCRYLRKCGLWMNTSEFSMRSNAFIFLWISEAHALEIQKKLRHPLSSQPTKANQFIFLELERKLTDEEQDKLCELMREWSMKNRKPELSDWLSWEEASPLLQDLSKDECSFLSNCNISFHKGEGKGATEDAKPKPQDTNVNTAKPSFMLVQKCTLNNYAVSLIPKPDGEWKEFQAKRPSVQKLIVYPPPPTKGGLGVTEEDLECLEQGEFLNDVIIDFYLKYLLLEKVPHQLAERSHIFSSFFFKCLTRAENTIPDESPNISAAQRRHHGVKRWTRHVDIFKKDFIFVPVNEESHWYLAVICFPHLEKAVYEERKRPTEPPPPPPPPPPQVETEEQEDSSRKSTVIVFNDALSRKEEMGGNSSPQSEGDGDPPSTNELSTTQNSKGLLEKHSGKTKVCRRPCILIFDSLKAGSVQSTASVLREYLEVEWSIKRKSAREFSGSSMRDFCPRVPKQDNSSDCGVYLLQYAESFFKTPIVSFEPPMHMEHWFPRHVVRSKRGEIRDLILRLHLQQRSAHSS